MSLRTRIVLTMACVCIAVLCVAPLWAVVEPDETPVSAKAFAHPDLNIPNVFEPAAAPKALAATNAFTDKRSGRFGTLISSEPMIPGRGNDLTWGSLKAAAPSSPADLQKAAWSAFTRHLQSHSASFAVDLGELKEPGNVTVHRGGELVQINATRQIDGIPVRDSYLHAVINHGNLVLYGSRNWGDVRTSSRPSIESDRALAAVRKHLGALDHDGFWRKPELVFLPMARGQQLSRVASGAGYDYRLAWVLGPRFEGEIGRYEALVDAHSGELLAFQDTNEYATTRQVSGGVLPIANDGVNPDGIEQAGWPMPFADVTVGGETRFTDAGGNLLACVDGNATSTLTGRYMNMNDNCGAISLTSSGDIDFGTSGGTDCTTPGFGGAGNTHASRSGFYEINRMQEMARAQLPNNIWLTETLTANMNINLNCNATWNGSQVNFYTSGGGCGNTGEIAGIYDHEWGHGMDDNDANPTISTPGEGIADIYAFLRLDTSCIGRSFQGGNCGGYGDPCTNCSGVRDINWANRSSGQPHDIAWIDANCGTANQGPCGGSTHCEGSVYAESVYDLVKRDLTAAPYNMSSNTAHEVGTYLTFNGAGPVGNWFQCSQPFGGCNADGGYLNYLAADDDNGNLSDGTPHMQAIFNAFNRHGIACGTPTVQDSGCAGTPTSAPSVTASPIDRGVSLSWGAVSGASSYQVFRTDGVFGCDFGKVKVGEVTGTSFADTGLQNGHEYYYTVIPMGPTASCFGPASSCTTVTPTAGANLALDVASASLTIGSGDGDVFLDNCEAATMSFDVINVGTGSATNARIVGVTSPTHPAISFTTTFPSTISASLAACGAGSGSFDFTAEGLSFDETVEFVVEVTSDELSPITQSAVLRVSAVESDFQTFASTTFSFEGGTDGWQVIQGTFNRTNSGGGGNGTSFYEASSANLSDQCDHIRSPVISLSATSTMSLFNQFDIEPIFQGSTWYDRANVGLYDVATGARTPVNPDGGRQYNASGANGSCGTGGQQGWASANTSWASSSWSASALGSAGVAGDLVQLDVRYGTDASLEGFGFHFDEVTLTDVDLQVADTGSDSCVPTVCGNNVIEGNEVCDGTDLGGATCGDFNCGGGTLACNLTCTGYDTTGCTSCTTCGNGTCEAGEDCDSCPADCPSETIPGASCGNGVCEAGNGENCVNCAADCNGVQSGRPANRYCCGDGGGQNPVSCGDSRCSASGNSCTTTPANPLDTCCGDLVCEGNESSANCPLDCGAAPVCGDGTCNGNEDQCSCAADCGAPPLFEVPGSTCFDGFDNDCDLATDCSDSDCDGIDPLCSCGAQNSSCTQNSDCCSGSCKRNGRCR